MKKYPIQRRKTLRNLVGTLLLILGLLKASISLAWDGNVVGTVFKYDLVAAAGGAPDNFDFRVYLIGGPALCTGGASWAYVNSTEANYNALVAAIISAKATNSKVQLYTVTTGSYCHIGYVAVWN